MALAFATSFQTLAATQALSVRSDGMLLKDGVPYAAVGVNYFDCFLRTLHNAKDGSYETGFQVLATNGIPFARFAATGFWPADMQLYQTNRPEYFRRFDRVVQSAETNGIGLIPSLFWHHACVPDLMGEPIRAWGDPKSRTHEFQRTYVREVLLRYKDSPSIWAWEFGNEFNLACNLPNATEHRPPIHPKLGTAAFRTVKDDLTYADLAVALKEFSRAVRQLDPHRPISTGNSILRQHAWHNLHLNSWIRDSEEQFQEMVALTNPDPVDLVSVHCYGSDWNRLASCARAAAKLRRPLFVGEFQVHGIDSPQARIDLQNWLEDLRVHRVPLAAVWVFDYPPQQGDFNVSYKNQRLWQLEMIGRWNRRSRR